MSSKNTVEVLLASMTEQVTHLEQRKKQLESQCKQLKSEVEVVEVECAKQVAASRAATDAKIAAIQAEVAPFAQLRSQIDAAKVQLEKTKQSILDETAALRAARHDTLSDLESRISEKLGRLARLTQEEEAFRARILANV